MDFKTPKRKTKLNDISTIQIPASPFMKKIGYGTGVAVYELERSPALNKFRSPWAIKKLLKNVKSKQTGKRLTQEAEVLRKLNHPNIVGFRAFVQLQDGNNCLAMEECDGCLGDLIETRSSDDLGAFPAHDILKVGTDVSNALDYLHTKALLMHCDLKSYNVLTKGKFQICKLCDFGVSLPVNADGDLASDKYVYEGTPSWCAPEVFNEAPIVTVKADIYAFGLVLWEMLALMPPVFDEDDSIVDVSDEESFASVSGRKRPPLPDVEFGDEYTFVLEVFHCCTRDEFKLRPSANDLKLIFEEIAAAK